MRDDAVPVHLSYRQASDCNSAKSCSLKPGLAAILQRKKMQRVHIENDVTTESTVDHGAQKNIQCRSSKFRKHANK